MSRIISAMVNDVISLIVLFLISFIMALPFLILCGFVALVIWVIRLLL